MNTDKNPQTIKNMFNKIAEKYDFVNNLISFYTHKIFKLKAIKSLEIKDEHKILDLCCGSGDISRIIKKISPKSEIIGVDFSPNMLNIAKRKNKNIKYIEADATNLPFLDNEFDIIIIGFGLRNIENFNKALDEIYRILKKDGQFLHLDFEGNSKFSFLYDWLILLILKFFIENIEPYKYLINSKKEFYNTKELIKNFNKKGFNKIKSQNFLNIISYQLMKKD